MGMIVCGYLSVLFAMAATLVGIRNGYRRVTKPLSVLYRCSRLETLLVVALVLVVVGVGVVGDVVLTWAQGSFGTLSKQRQMTAGATALVLGGQSFFGAFLLSVIAGNESDLEKAVHDATRRRLRRAR
jgi:hypothetical protein